MKPTNIESLKEILLRLKIRPDFYSLHGGLPNEAYCVDSSGDSWYVYYSERGQKTGLTKFESESKACTYFLNLITSDSIVMSNLE
ncbi:hypothetical protein EPD60_07560 [Flaviaesturariibacter flavus]|uniref:Uncharacterized protein n=1 Tax=Flaviaesturariibacter flavus TaxID=2502780 RepID=A0A4R1BGQ9_9BACT|nr:hypothetical protein EPD60_07885 [Flaviaesturariibacter flavus]TCJ16390.1 hypothetical protein EPD60_07560 [Flaviaesturariibacter flavus]